MEGGERGERGGARQRSAVCLSVCLSAGHSHENGGRLSTWDRAVSELDVLRVDKGLGKFLRGKMTLQRSIGEDEEEPAAAPSLFATPNRLEDEGRARMAERGREEGGSGGKAGQATGGRGGRAAAASWGPPADLPLPSERERERGPMITWMESRY